MQPGVLVALYGLNRLHFKADRKPFQRTVHRRDADRDASLLGPELAMLLERGVVKRLERVL